jgi:type I restriction enzyme R subunit
MSLSEADTIAKLITPNLYQCGWTEEHIKREENAGAIEIINGRPRRGRKRADLTLRLKIHPDAQPVAVALIEAKADHLPPTHGLEQGKLYADSKRLNVPFVYSSNGHLFVEYDRFTGLTTKPRPMADFPTCDELRERYERGMGFSLEDPAAKPLLIPYATGEGSRRYYQDAAIRAVLEKLAVGEKRALLSLATGAGKTFIAVNLLKRIADAGQLGRALFVCDRDELRSQAIGAFQNVFGNDAAVVTGHNPQHNARVLIVTYQTLGVEGEAASFLTANYPLDYFSHIIIDECHRSAWGKWSQILTRNPNAVHIGLTATPRQLAENAERGQDESITPDNIQYFGEPVYEYEIGQGIEDGYLSACEIQLSRVNLDDTGITLEDILARRPVDAITGHPITEDDLSQLYEKYSYEDRILLPDRVLAMCRDMFRYLIETGGPEQKTIIFCVRDTHADAVAIEMNNLYAEWCRANYRQPAQYYAFKCTAASGGSDYLADLRGSTRSHFIATTVDLLTTGVDVPQVRNIVFFRYMRSPIVFYQMLGRGTRIHAPTDKLMFRVYDYTDATRLFGEEFITRMAAPSTSEPQMDTDREREPIVQVEGFDVRVTDAGRFIVTSIDGKAMPITVEEYKERLAAKLVVQAATLEQFRAQWIIPVQRSHLLDSLPEHGRSALLVQRLEEMDDYDLFDVLAELGYGIQPLTRIDRAGAFSYKHALWLDSLPPQAAATLQALASQFARAGTDGLENPQIFQTPEVRHAGGVTALTALGKPAEIMLELKRRVFAA